jgi:hypothetical protein
MNKTRAEHLKTLLDFHFHFWTKYSLEENIHFYNQVYKTSFCFLEIEKLVILQ